MILNLPFKKWFYFTEKPVEVNLNLGVLEDTCKHFGIDFWQITETIKDKDFDFSVELLYQGYLDGCRRGYKKPKYNRIHAGIWYEYMSVSEKGKYLELMRALFGSVSKSYGGKKKVK